MRDSCGLEIVEGFYSDCGGFHYYHVKKTSNTLLIRDAKEKQYSLLKESLAPNLRRIDRQDELIELINSVEQTSPKCTENVHYGDDIEAMRAAQRD